MISIPSKSNHEQGAALIIALAFLLLISAVVLAFFNSAKTDRKNAMTFADSQKTIRLADTAVSVVMSQVRDATSAADTAWASQPGMIRTYGTNGMLTRAFKLYSSDEMAPTQFGATELAAETTAMANWQEQPAHFVDLNSPAVVPRQDPANPEETKNFTVFPIVDPRAAGLAADGKPEVEGFSYTATIPGVVPTTGAAMDTQRLPMPVKWLYVLRDGSLIAPSAVNTATKTATFVSTDPATPVPTRDNPITGRIAFWTDDDTSKVNINTASEGSFWDVPRSVAKEEAYMGWRIPVQGEFQAVGGHPATTSLSPVLGALLDRPESPLKPFNIVEADYAKYYAPYYGLTPRVSDTTVGNGALTSRGGSRDTTVNGATVRGRPVAYDTNRLYSTTDELLFNPSRALNNSNLTADQLARRDFFLTSQSRAPETTLFGTPRVSLWPNQRLPSHPKQGQTSRDKLLAFCGTVGSQPFYFERAAAGVGRGVSGLGSAGSMTTDYTSIPRNQRLHTFLQTLMNKPVPGFGASFANKWSAVGAETMATLSFDYLRSGLNLFQAPPPSGSLNGTRDGDFSWGYEIPVGTSNQGGYIAPLKIGNTIGFGRNTTINEVAVVFLAEKSENKKTTSMQTAMFFNLFRPTPNSAAAAPAIRFRVSSPFGISGELRMKARAGIGTDSGRNFSFVGAHTMLSNNAPGSDQAPRIADNSPTASIDNAYPFYSNPVAVVGDTFDFSGGTVVIEILEPDAAVPQVIQTLRLYFPPIKGLALPQGVDVAGKISDSEAKSFSTRLGGTVLLKGESLFRVGDIVRSVRFSSDPAAPHRGDLRMLSLQTSVDENSKWFEPHPNYFESVLAYDENGTIALSSRRNRFAQSFRNDFFSINKDGRQYGWSDGKNGPPDLNAKVMPHALGAGFDYTKPDPQKIKAGGLIDSIIMGNLLNPAPTPVIPAGLIEARNSVGLGDFTSNYGMAADGATLMVPDFGTLRMKEGGGFFSELTWFEETEATFEPNRQAPSPIIFGTLPGLSAAGNPQPWQTLLFNPHPSAGSVHPGFGIGTGATGPTARSPFTVLPDHLFLDLWWMPAVDPYALSEPLSTAGKVNLNYQIAPFTYIKRATGIQSALKAVKLAAVANVDSSRYKAYINNFNIYDNSKNQNFCNIETRFNLDVADTSKTVAELETNGSLMGFADRFRVGDIFRSASEICTVPLVALGRTASNMDDWWNNRRLTGDNLLESPYNALYSRVTTKSNTFTVHYRVEALMQVPGLNRKWDEWTEGKDQVVGEYRGATTLERYLDTEQPNLPDYAGTSLPAEPIDKYYRLRVLSTRQFAP